MGKSGFNFFVNAYEVTPTEYAAWKEVNVQTFIPSGSSGVILEFSNTDNSLARIIAARKKGSNDDFTGRSDTQKVSGHVYNVCGVDANRKFEAYVENASCEIWLIGYTDASVVMFTNMVDKKTTTSGWVEVNVASIVSNDATGVICAFLTKDTVNQEEGLIRKKGSTDYETGKNLIRGPVDCLCGLSDSKIFEQRVGNASSGNLELYVKGYTKLPVEWFTNVVKKGPVTQEAVWEDINISGDVPSGTGGVIIEIVNFNSSAQSTHVSVRRKGSSDNRVEYDDRIRYTGHIWALVGVDENRIFQAQVIKDEAGQSIANVKFYLHGYCSWDGSLKTKLEQVSTDIEVATSANPLANYLGSTIRCKLTVTDETDVAIDADTLTLKIYDPTGSLTDISGTEFKASTGVYYIDYTILTSYKAGDWALVTTVSRSGKIKTDVEQITLKSPI